MHVIPNENINSLEDWQRRWYERGAVIKDEYGETLPPVEMQEIITNRSWQRIRWIDFYFDENAEPGPNNLLRHKIDGSHCIGHGPGTWDYIIGKFS